MFNFSKNIRRLLKRHAPIASNDKPQNETKKDPSDNATPLTEAPAIKETAVIEGMLLHTTKGVYKLQAFGEGGICQVFKGLPVGIEPGEAATKALLIKRIHPKWHANDQVKTQFKREISIVSDFIHPLLPRYMGRGTLEGQDYLAYAFVEGFTLIHYLRNKTLYPREKISARAPYVLGQLLEQLHYLHSQMSTVIHGDISIENIIYGKDNKAHLIDFGCAYRKNKVTDHNYHWLGKPSYVTPEQARGEVWAEQSDLYQAGVVFYELVTGQRWNQGKTSREKMLFSANATSPKNNFLHQWVDLSLSELLARMLAANPHERIESAKDCLTQLSPFINRIK